jgi:hypothetical protein
LGHQLLTDLIATEARTSWVASLGPAGAIQSRKNDTMTARSHERRIPFATIFRATAAVLPSRASGQDLAGGNLR